ncbi:hypothetical protein GCM10025883_32860 [Mobilicoccus caccae]|uniref:DUF86 domain-containing protein n=2 Tax=Mobilicoccus caccae TaxID=1859295 RepID=A0ABQ6IUY3_9MICO|nr:hypothetical protein GCM10025883_32860 [Mobilicoccus caccae]
MHDLLGYLAGLEALGGDELRADLGLRLAVERALCQLVDQAVDINAHIAARVIGRAPTTQRESFDLAARAGYLSTDLASALTPSIGLRNVLVHDYVSADLDLVAAAVPLALREYRAFVTAMARAFAPPPD